MMLISQRVPRRGAADHDRFPERDRAALPGDDTGRSVAIGDLDTDEIGQLCRVDSRTPLANETSASFVGLYRHAGNPRG